MIGCSQWCEQNNGPKNYTLADDNFSIKKRESTNSKHISITPLLKIVWSKLYYINIYEILLSNHWLGIPFSSERIRGARNNALWVSIYPLFIIYKIKYYSLFVLTYSLSFSHKESFCNIFIMIRVLSKTISTPLT